MSTNGQRPPAGTDEGLRLASVRAAGGGVAGIEQLAGGFGTALAALAALAWTVLTLAACLVGVGLVLLPASAHLLRSVAARERARLARWGPPVVAPPPVPRGVRAVMTESSTRRELAWAAVHATCGLVIGLIGILLPLLAIRDLTFPLYWRALPADGVNSALGFAVPPDWRGIGLVFVMGIGWVVLIVVAAPALARLQARPGRWLLPAHAHADLAVQVAHLTATRAAALDAHASELHRIERSLHDGTQNRIVAVTVLLGAARRALTRDPATADEILERAQTAAELALADLRAVVRSILPPVLLDRGLVGALSGLAAQSPVPCHVEADVEGRCPASVEATAYFVVAEALTNAARHGHARNVAVSVRRIGDRLAVSVMDDGRGGADETLGSGLGGIRRRVEAHDGTMTLTSPRGGPTIVEVDLPCGS
jgi:signal transduction histidine kinase